VGRSRGTTPRSAHVRDGDVVVISNSAWRSVLKGWNRITCPEFSIVCMGVNSAMVF